MRVQFSEDMEKSRLKHGRFATLGGERNGMFELICPLTGQKLRIIASDGSGWNDEECPLPGDPWEHVSVSAMTRCPTWGEMCWVKEQFFENNEIVVQFHPAKSEYVNDHPFVLHLWRPIKSPVPMPPIVCV